MDRPEPGHDTSVPEVEPNQLQAAFAVVLRWLKGVSESPRNPSDAPDILEVIEELHKVLAVPPPMAVALLKRSLALLLFCAEAEVPRELFDKGQPTSGLWLAASRTPVIDPPGDGNATLRPFFNHEELIAVYRRTLS